MKRRKIHVGLRTVKTAVAIIIAMVLVEPYGATRRPASSWWPCPRGR